MGYKPEACWYISDLAVGVTFSVFDPEIVVFSLARKSLLLHFITLHCNAPESSTMILHHGQK